VSKRLFRPDSKQQEHATRSLHETMERRRPTQCAATQSGLRCVGTTGHEGSHWCWVLDRMMTWEDVQ
jgi:hypothetical protein